MNKILKKVINGILSVLFLFIKSKSKRAAKYTFVSRLLFDKNNSLEYDPKLNGFWLKSKDEYLFIAKKPYYNFSKKNLYKSIKDIYCKNYFPKKDDVIVDIGAGIGTEVLFFHEQIGENGKIYSIEASTDSYTKLNALCSKNRITNSFNYNIAISNFNGKIWLEETENFEVNQINNTHKGIEINCFTLDQFVKDNGITKIDLLKVNIEGAELPMLNGMNECINIVQNIAVSCHDFLFKEDKHIKTSIVKYLEKNNFQIIYNDTKNIVVDSWIYGKRIK
ncbi:MAG: FkbM family methyltransferase [Bacteroidota bacterium]